ncbi:hypothetical protein AB1Y20_006761 [Prymnesium parvum]|uniref:EF-hand domain-containing protein n=1 Tax=Prymnesium parvum TaxID=97485 RepID=A0AB34IZB0_PRYPA
MALQRHAALKASLDHLARAEAHLAREKFILDTELQRITQQLHRKAQAPLHGESPPGVPKLVVPPAAEDPLLTERGIGTDYWPHEAPGSNGVFPDGRVLEDLLHRAFAKGDADHDGMLNMAEFKATITRMNNEVLKLSDKEVLRLMAEADVNGDGMVEYKEFVPLAVDLLQALAVRQQVDAQTNELTSRAREEARELLSTCVPEQELHSAMLSFFQKADVDRSGMLDEEEFRTCIRSMDIGLSRREINSLMFAADSNGDGKVSFEELAPVLFDIQVEILTKQLIAQGRPTPVLAEVLLRLCAYADQERTGLLPQSRLRQIFQSSDLELSRLQTSTLMGAAETNALPDGMIKYKEFIPRAAVMIHRFLDRSIQEERRHALELLRQPGIPSETKAETAMFI